MIMSEVMNEKGKKMRRKYKKKDKEKRRRYWVKR